MKIYSVGELVQSTYRRSRWVGEVVEIDRRRNSKGTPFYAYFVKPLYTPDGRRLRKVHPRWMHEYWLRKFYNEESEQWLLRP